MSVDNKAVVRAFAEEVMSQGNLAVIDELVAPDFVGHGYPESPHYAPGREGTRQFVSAFRTGFPDLQVAIQSMIAEGDLVVARWVLRGTHRGPMLGIAPTGKQVEVTGIIIDRLADGKVVEEWIDWDRLGLLQQLGVIPPVSRVGR